MKYNIRGEKLEVTEAIKEYIHEKLGKMDKYFNESDNISANVLIKVKGNDEIIEVTIPCNKFVLRAEEANEDLYAAIDKLADKLERQIRKNKTRMKKYTEINKYDLFNFNYEVEEDEINKSKVVKRKAIDIKPMDEEEAILQMEMLGHDFFMYKDLDSKVCVMYKRKDGSYGVLETL